MGNVSEKPLSLMAKIVWTFVVVNALGAAATLILFPEQTESLFFWNITPPINAALFGGAYLVAGLAVLQALVRGRWESQRYLIPMILGFTSLLLLTSLLHTDRFIPGFKLYYWLAVYVVAPLAAAFFYWQHERGGANWQVTTPVAPGVRTLAAALGGIVALFTAYSFIFPEQVAALYVWPISPLMVRVFASWSAAVVGALLWLAREREWTRVQLIPTWMIVLGAVFLLLVYAHRDQLKPEMADRAWLVYVGLVGVSLGGVGLHIWQRQATTRLRRAVS